MALSAETAELRLVKTGTHLLPIGRRKAWHAESLDDFRYVSFEIRYHTRLRARIIWLALISY